MAQKKDGQRFVVVSPKGLRTLSRDHINVAPPRPGGDRAWTRADAARTNDDLAPPEEVGPEYVLERFVAHKRLEDGSLMLLVGWLSYSPVEGTWKKSTSLPREAVAKRKGLLSKTFPRRGCIYAMLRAARSANSGSCPPKP